MSACEDCPGGRYLTSDAVWLYVACTSCDKKEAISENDAAKFLETTSGQYFDFSRRTLNAYRARRRASKRKRGGKTFSQLINDPIE